MEKTVSVVMPVHNCGAFVEEAIASVDAQTWPEIELLVIDDGSTDDTGDRVAAAARSWTRPPGQLRILSQKNAGAGAARNTGLARASGDIVVFMDADDRLHPRLIEKHVAHLETDQSVDLVFPCHRFINEIGTAFGYTSAVKASRFSAFDLMGDNPINSASGVAVRKDAIDRAGRFDPTMPACIDLDLWVRVGLLRERNILASGEVLADYRKRSGQITGDWQRMRQGWLRLVDKLAEADRALSPAALQRARARQTVFWSAIAYHAGDYAAARRLIMDAWARDPGFVLRSHLGRIRTLACLATLLPRPMHDGLRNYRRRRLL